MLTRTYEESTIVGPSRRAERAQRPGGLEIREDTIVQLKSVFGPHLRMI